MSLSHRSISHAHRVAHERALPAGTESEVGEDGGAVPDGVRAEGLCTLEAGGEGEAEEEKDGLCVCERECV